MDKSERERLRKEVQEKARREGGNYYEPCICALLDRIDALERQVEKANGVIAVVADRDNEPRYHHEGMGCGLEDRNIRDRYEAMAHGWECAMERVYSEVIGAADEYLEEQAAIASAQEA